MSIKLVVTDLDDTLLRRDKTISDYTVRVFERLRERGILIAFATARPHRSTYQFSAFVPVDAVICCNGASAWIGDTLLGSFGIAPTETQRILAALSADYPTLHLYTEIGDRYYANGNQSAFISGVDNYTQTDFVDLPPIYADKIGIILEDSRSPDIFEKYLSDGLYMQIGTLLYGGEGKIINILNRQASKKNCIFSLAEHYGIDLSQVAAFGDDYNDVEMLKSVGYGVAVANAVEECKHAAAFHCGDCDSDGVAQWLERELL